MGGGGASHGFGSQGKLPPLLQQFGAGRLSQVRQPKSFRIFRNTPPLLYKVVLSIVSSSMNIVPAAEETDAEVRREDQDNINRFARLNARLHELRDERDLIQVRLCFDGRNEKISFPLLRRTEPEKIISFGAIQMWQSSGIILKKVARSPTSSSLHFGQTILLCGDLGMFCSLCDCSCFSILFTQKTLERLDDASTELMMASGDNVMLFIGESFFDTTEEEATEYCESEVERMQGQLEELETEEEEIVQSQAELKKVLYSRFGKSIQLEEN